MGLMLCNSVSSRPRVRCQFPLFLMPSVSKSDYPATLPISWLLEAWASTPLQSCRKCLSPRTQKLVALKFLFLAPFSFWDYTEKCFVCVRRGGVVAVVMMWQGWFCGISESPLLWFTLECGVYRPSSSSARSPSSYSKAIGKVLLSLLWHRRSMLGKNSQSLDTSPDTRGRTWRIGSHS